MAAAYTGINVSRIPWNDDDYVIGVSMRFHTKAKDKDHDTSLDIRICNEEGILFAEKSGIAGHWAEKTSYLVAFDLKNSLPLSQVSKGSVHLEIHPNGNDCWHFKCDLWIFYSNGHPTLRHWDGKELSQDCRSTSDDWEGAQSGHQ